MARFVAGIDGGGSQTTACLVDADTGAVAWGEAGASNPHAVGLVGACEAIEEALGEAARRLGRDPSASGLDAAEALVCCLSGAGRAEEQEAIRTELVSRGVATQVSVCNDAEAVLASATVSGTGIAVIAGTGSFAWGRNGAGETTRADGWGNLLGDESGGFGIAQEALRAACRHHDGRGPETRLLKMALEHFCVDAAPELIALLATPEIPRGAVAGFAPSVFRAAEIFDPAAIAIVERAAAELAKSTLAVRNRLFAADEVCTVVVGGGVARNEPFLREQFAARLHASSPRDRILLPAAAPALGAARLALVSAGVDPTAPALRDTDPPEAIGGDAGAESHARALRVFEECAGLLTEQRNPASVDIDEADAIDIVRLMNLEDAGVAPAVEKELPEIAEAVDRITKVIRDGGRLFYVGAGTSGRLGCLDAAECPPTFGTPPNMVQAVIAGGLATLLRSREGAEDQSAVEDLQDRAFGPGDILVGLAASRRTPYVLSALQHARAVGAQTVLVTCSPPPEPMESVDVLIAPVVGPEVVMGSTRLKAATAQKMVLNMLTTASMVRLGKTYRGMMVDLQMSCGKLAERAKRTIMMLTGLDYEACSRVLSDADGSVKRAIVMARADCSTEEAGNALERADGRVADAITALACSPANPRETKG